MQLKKKSREEAQVAAHEARKPVPAAAAAAAAGPLANQRCRATTSSNHNLDAWCDSNCKVGFCPEDKCVCETPSTEELAVEEAANAAAIAEEEAADAAEAAATAAENALLPQGVPAP